ncbi:hypothetical protein PENTCL1PPCAC_1327, partial [Pristionchus entomophagus]
GSRSTAVVQGRPEDVMHLPRSAGDRAEQMRGLGVVVVMVAGMPESVGTIRIHPMHEEVSVYRK